MKGYGRFTQRLKVKKFSIKCVFKLGLDDWLCVLFSLWCLLFEDLEFQWWDSERRFCSVGSAMPGPLLCTLHSARGEGVGTSPRPCAAAPRGQDRACDCACDTRLLRVERATAFSGFRAGPPGREHPCLAWGRVQRALQASGSAEARSGAVRG